MFWQRDLCEIFARSLPLFQPYWLFFTLCVELAFLHPEIPSYKDIEKGSFYHTKIIKKCAVHQLNSINFHSFLSGPAIWAAKGTLSVGRDSVCPPEPWLKFRLPAVDAADLSARIVWLRSGTISSDRQCAGRTHSTPTQRDWCTEDRTEMRRDSSAGLKPPPDNENLQIYWTDTVFPIVSFFEIKI